MNGFLANDHADLAELLSELYTALDAGDVTLSYARLDHFWARLGVHIRAEHLVLFPAIARTLSALARSHPPNSPSLSKANSMIEELRADHDFFMHELARVIAAMRDLIANDGQDAASVLRDVRARVVAVEERLSAHNMIEESQVYIWMATVLSDEEQAELAGHLQNELGNMPPRFSEPNSNLM